MPEQVLRARDTTTGDIVSFKWFGETAPTEDDLADVFAAHRTRAPQPTARAAAGLPDEPGNLALQAARGLGRSVMGTVQFGKDVASAAQALPVVAKRAAGFAEPDVVAATRRGLVEPAQELAQAARHPKALAQSLAGLEPELTRTEQIGKTIGDIGQALLLRKVPGPARIVRGLRRANRLEPSTPMSRPTPDVAQPEATSLMPPPSVTRADELIQNMKGELARMAPLVEGQPPIPKAKVSATEFRAIETGRTELRARAAGPMPQGMEGQIDRLRLEYLRTQAEAVTLRKTGGRAAQQMEQAARELGSRLSNAERSAIRLAKAGKGERGAISLRAAMSLGGGIAGAGVGAALTQGESSDTRLGAMLALGLVGTRGASALARWAETRPDRGAGLFDALNAVRTELLLTGTAIPKNVVGGFGATIQAAGEQGSIRPIVEAMRPIKGLRAFKSGVTKPIDVGIAGRPRPRGPVSRLISGVDKAFMESLRRAGLASDEIDRLLLRRPIGEFMSRGLTETLQTTLGRALAPFQRTPVNVFGGGAEELTALVAPKQFHRLTGVRGATSGPGLQRRRNVTKAAVATGAGAALATEDLPAPQRALALGLLTAAGGVRALPVGMGAAFVGGTEALRGLAPFPEYALDPRSIVDPREWLSALRVARQLSGQR